MPSNSTVITMQTPSSTSPHGSLRLRIPLMTVAISRACGAAIFSLPMPGIHCTSICPLAGEYRYLPSGSSGEPSAFRSTYSLLW